tara:strand:- start:1642 stop:1953 length:312 start_codon:yes stop_codon:yes gene_type:complete
MSGSFSYKITTENEQFTFDYSPVLGTTETILSATCTVEVKEGTDPTPSAILVGSPSISGSQVAQRISGGLDGVIYRLQMTATTSATNVYTIVGDLPVLSPMNV